MAQSFDPYLQWLGIRDPQRPPNHYRLLGLELFESDADVIAGAADRQMTHVRSFQSGQHSELSQKILNELAAARVCLLKPERKAAYDADLCKQVAAKAVPVAKPATTVRTSPVQTVAVAQVARPSESSLAMAEIAAIADASSGSASRTRSRHRKAAKKSPLPLLASAVLALVAIVAIAFALKDPAQPVAQNPTSTPPLTSKPADHSPPATKNDTTNKPATDPSTPQKATGAAATKPDQPIEEPPATTDLANDAPTSTQPEEMPNEDPPSDAPETPSVDDLVTDGEDEPTDEPAGEPFEEFPEDDEPAIPAIAAPPADKRLPVPEKAGQDASLAIIKDLFKSEFTLRKPEERAAFAQKLLAQGHDTANDPTSAYVLFDQAMSIAATAGDPDTAMNSASQLGDLYQVDALELKAATLTTLARTAKTPQAVQLIASQAESLTEKAIDQDRFDYAKRFNALVLSAARKAKDLSLVNQAQARLRVIKQLETEQSKLASSLAMLKESPNDPGANFAVGSYWCFVKGNFDVGLPMLKIGSDKILQAIAIAELAKPTEARKQLALAEAWDSYADRRNPAMIEAKRRARKWYLQSLDELEGLEKAKVEKRLATLSEIDAVDSMASLVSIELTPDIKLAMRRVPAGKFWMGSPPTEPGRSSDENLHEVTISRPFLLGVTEVTQAQWEAVMGSNSSEPKGENLPVNKVTWQTAIRFCDRLNSSPLGANYRFRLPSEAEWEYACRAGTNTIFYWGNDPVKLSSHAWTLSNSGRTIQPVGKLQPNSWGFYDMIGNVAEWTGDWHGPLPTVPQRDPKGPEGGKEKSNRGFTFANKSMSQFRSAAKCANPPDEIRDYLGLRLAAEVR
jgi:formylglycine-generating enzyme required for sulfatase activity